MWLKISNPISKMSPKDIVLGLSVLGLSTSRGRSEVVGAFGSGSIHGVATLLRQGIRPTICCGLTKMEYFTKPEYAGGQVFNRICVKYGGDRSGIEESSIAQEFGELDWGENTRMALREFVSNAIDGAVTNGGTFKDIKLEIVENVRAKNGWVSVYIPYTEVVEQAFSEIPKTFLHLSNHELLDKKILPKVREDKVRVYKKGVLVTELNHRSIFDYNLGDELTLDESRNASEWAVRYAVAKAIAGSPSSVLAQLIRGLSTTDDYWESNLDGATLSSHYEVESVKEKRKAAWQEAWKAVGGDKGVAVTCGVKQIAQFVEGKGYKAIPVHSASLMRALDAYGAQTETTVLDRNERDGKTVGDPTPEMIAAVDRVWAVIESFGLANGKSKPKVKSFTQIMEAEAQTWGFYEPGSQLVYLHTDLGGALMNKVALEECCHHASQATDNSRDFQDYILRLLTTIAF